MSEKEKLDETQRRVAACLNAFDGIPTDKIEGKNLGEILAGEMRLNNAGPRADGGFGFEFSGGVCQLMAEAFAEQFKQSGAINYLELLFDHSDIGPLTITMQRVDGLTPAHKLAKAESERDALQQKLDAVLADNVALKEQCAGEMSRAANDIAYAIFNLADMKMTDLKPGIIESTGPAETALIAERNLRDMAAQLRAETDTTPSQYESLAGGK